MHIKIRGGTASNGESSLCLICRFATVVRGASLRDEIVERSRDERRWLGRRCDLRDRLAQRPDDISVRRLLEPNVAVADLHGTAVRHSSSSRGAPAPLRSVPFSMPLAESQSSLLAKRGDQPSAEPPTCSEVRAPGYPEACLRQSGVLMQAARPSCRRSCRV